MFLTLFCCAFQGNHLLDEKVLFFRLFQSHRSQRPFVGLAGDLNDLVSWLSSFLQFGHNRFTNTTNFMHSHSGFGVPNIDFWTLNYGQVQRTRIRISKGRLLRNSPKSLTGSFGPPSAAHISCGVFRCLTVKPPVRVFVGFSLKRTHFAISPLSSWIHTTQSLVHKHRSGLGGLENQSVRTKF